MRAEFTCGDPAVLAGYLYDECEAQERAAIEAHLASCAACIAELAALGATRQALASWTPPDATLGFRITSSADAASDGHTAATVLRPARWWQRPLPAWAQAAAAIVIFASGALLGMRTATTPAGLPPASVQTAGARTAGVQTAAPAASAVSARDLAALEARLRAEMNTLRAAGTGAPAASTAGAPASAASDAALLQRVRTLLAESEQRQQRELALRLAQVVRDVDTQRRMDLARIDRTFGQMEGYTRPELADQRDMINYLIQRTGLQRAPQ